MPVIIARRQFLGLLGGVVAVGTAAARPRRGLAPSLNLAPSRTLAPRGNR